ncbi:42467_t:CDS:2, partial [Gigaspora margarita]
MNQICTLKDLNNDNKLEDALANYYPPSQTELEKQLSCTKKDHEDDLDKSKKDNEKLSDRVHQLGEETIVKELEQDLSLAQNELSEIEFLKNESELENTNLFLAKLDLEKILSKERDELTQI